MEGKFIVASGPVIIEQGSLLVSKDNKDDFYKFIGGTVKEGEDLEEACIRQAKEACNAEMGGRVQRGFGNRPHRYFGNRQVFA